MKFQKKKNPPVLFAENEVSAIAFAKKRKKRNKIKKKSLSLMNKIPECYSIYFISQLQFQEMGQIEGIDVI